ncbi:hypothetical protein SprV_0100063500 [Sparganum proliferum]
MDLRIPSSDGYPLFSFLRSTTDRLPQQWLLVSNEPATLTAISTQALSAAGMNGEVWLGPSATLSFKREGYSNLNFSLKDTLDFIAYPGLLRLASQYLTFGVREYYRGIFISQQVKQLQRYVPSLRTTDVERARAGIRAQALDSHGSFILHVRNTPSPGATSSMAIARLVTEKASRQFGLSQ